MTDLPTISVVRWPRSHRLISSRFPPIDLFDDLAPPEDWELLALAESRTNPRVLDEIGDLSLVPTNRRVSGPGASWLMAAFTHVSLDRPSRFSDGSYGVYYCAKERLTALYETAWHQGRFLAATAEEPGWILQMRELITPVDHAFHDLRNSADIASLDPASMTAGQALGAQLRQKGSDGIVYPSVRHSGGECLAVFWPNILSPPQQSTHWLYHWNGETIDYVKRQATNGGQNEVIELAW